MYIQLNETKVNITNFYENIAGIFTLNATNTFAVEDNTTFQDLSDLNGLELTSYSIVNSDGVRIPTQGLYTHVSGLTITYDDKSRLYTVNIILN